MKRISNLHNYQCIEKYQKLNEKAYNDYLDMYNQLKELADKEVKEYRVKLQKIRANYLWELSVIKDEEGYYNVISTNTSDLHDMDANNSNYKSVKTLVTFKLVNNVVIYHPNNQPFFLENLISGVVLNDGDIELLNKGILPKHHHFKITRKEYWRYS